MSSATVKVVGLDKLLKKLDASTFVEPKKTALLRDAAEDTKQSLRPTLPKKTGRGASKLSHFASELKAGVAIPRYPFIFLEQGSQYNDSGTRRVRRRKTAAQWRAGRFRISPRRFLSRERAKVRKRLVIAIEQMKDDLEREWSK